MNKRGGNGGGCDKVYGVTEMEEVANMVVTRTEIRDLIGKEMVQTKILLGESW